MTSQLISWKTILLPEDLLKRVDEIVEKPELGCISRSEFIKESVRLRVRYREPNTRKRTEKISCGFCLQCKNDFMKILILVLVFHLGAILTFF